MSRSVASNGFGMRPSVERDHADELRLALERDGEHRRLLRLPRRRRRERRRVDGMSTGWRVLRDVPASPSPTRVRRSSASGGNPPRDLASTARRGTARGARRRRRAPARRRPRSRARRRAASKDRASSGALRRDARRSDASRRATSSSSTHPCLRALQHLVERGGEPADLVGGLDVERPRGAAARERSRGDRHVVERPRVRAARASTRRRPRR